MNYCYDLDTLMPPRPQRKAHGRFAAGGYKWKTDTQHQTPNTK